MGRPAIVEAWLEDQLRSQTESYSKRGRAFASASIDELKQNWIKEFRGWMRDSSHPLQAMKDIEVELTMRGEIVPYDKVEPEWNALRERHRTERRRWRERSPVITTFPLAPVAPRGNPAGFLALIQHVARPER